MFKKLKELRAKKRDLEEKRSAITLEIRSLASEEKEDEARSKALEREKIEARMEIIEEEIESVLEEIEEERSKPLPSGGRELRTERTDKETRGLKLSALSKSIRGIELSEEERSVITSTQNGAVIPEEFIKQFEKLKEGYPSLKQYCQVIPVNRNAGKMPVRKGGSVNKLANLEEDKELVKAMLETKPMNYDINDYGLLAPIDNSLLEDSDINFLEFVQEEFAEYAVNTENNEIVQLMVSLLNEEVMPSYVELVKAINLLSPNARQKAVIVTNSIGRGYLDSLVDKAGRPLLKELSDGGDLIFKGRPVVELEEEFFDTKGKIKFGIADLKTLVKFLDRKQYLIDKSTEAGYTKNQTIARIIERFDVKSPVTKEDAKLRKFGFIAVIEEDAPLAPGEKRVVEEGTSSEEVGKGGAA